eukprot:IDg13796t1
MVRNLIDMELAYINTWHPDFVGGRQALTAAVAPPQPNGGPSFADSSAPAHPPSHREPSESWVEKNLLGQRGSAAAGSPVLDPLRGTRAYGTPQGAPSSAVRQKRQPPHVPTHGFPPPSAAVRGIGAATVNTTHTAAALCTHRHHPALLTTTSPTHYASRAARRYHKTNFRSCPSYAYFLKAILAYKDLLQSMLVSKLYRPESAASLLVEDGETAQRRKGPERTRRHAGRALLQIGEFHLCLFRRHERDARGALGKPRRAQVSLARDVAVRHVRLLAQQRDVRDHVYRVHVCRDSAHAFFALAQREHDFLD